MYKLFALFTAIFLLSTFTEIYDPVYTQDLQQIPTRTNLQTQPHNKNIILRSDGGDGSLLTYEKKNDFDEWSFEVTFVKPDLKYPEKAGIFVWYTNNNLEDIAREETNKFIGLMTGFEQHGLDTELMISAVAEQDDELVLRDVIPRKLLRNVAHVKMKIIYTKKNFKLELYDSDKLIYDALRLYDVKTLGSLEKGKSFSITTAYENVDAEKHYELTKAGLLKRVENESYNPYLKNSEYDHEINDDLEHAIADLDHFVRLIDHVLGKPRGSTVVQGVIGALNEAKEQKDKIESIKDKIYNMRMNLEVLPLVIAETELKMQTLIRKMSDLQYFIKSFDYKQKKSGSWLLILAGLCVLLTIIYNCRKSSKPKQL